MEGFLYQAFVYLAAGVVAVPVAQRLGLGSVLGYLIAGVIIGPLTGLVGHETKELQHFAEFGVVMMLFLVGLELEPRKLWELRNRLIGLGGLQVGITAALIAAGAIFMGLKWQTGIVTGLILALSSTAIVLQTLNEKGLLKTQGGEASFSVLLFQDIAVIPMLALIPLLAIPELVELAGSAAGHGGDDGHATMSLVEGLPGWQAALVTIGAIAAVIAGGVFLSRPLFRFIAASKLREMFTAAALLLVIAIALLMTLVGLSPALGTFLAGVVLANSEYRHELESDIEPFKGLLLGLFFITVGAGIDFLALFANPWLVVGLVLGVMAIKAAVLFALARAFHLPRRDDLLFALGLAQAGEFGFVLLSFSMQTHVMDEATARTVSLVIALSMLLTPALFIFYDRVVSRFATADGEKEADEITEKGTVIIAGLGRFGQIVNRLLLANGHKTVVLDHRADLVSDMGKFGVRGFYGDATRPDLLHSAGLHEAAMLVVAIDDRERAVELVRHAKRENPKVHVIARAYDRMHVYQLYRAGADDIVRETFDSAVRASRYALVALGMHPFRADRVAHTYVQHDRAAVRHLAQLWKEDVDVMDNPEYINAAKERNRLIQEAISGMGGALHDSSERAWTPPPKPDQAKG